MKKCLSVLCIAVVVLSSAIQAQPVRSPDAEQEFQVALNAFESGDYASAFYGFRNVYERIPVHVKTTAAYLMAGKSLYRNGDYLAAIQLLGEFQTQYPTSQYTEASERLQVMAQRDLQRVAFNENAVRLGLALPLTASEFAVTQSLFRGVRFAVDSYNREQDQKVKIVFRDTQDSSSGARSAVNALLEEEVAAIIGPLFSEQVLTVARMTEQNQTVMVAPLATDPSLTEGRRNLFQVNATLAERGRFIARQAITYLNLKDIGIVTEAGSDVSQEMARGFKQELAQNGITPQFTYEVKSTFDWSRLPQLIGRDILSGVEGIYFSVYRDNESEASRFIQDGVNSLYQAALNPAVLGPSAWHSLNLDQLGGQIKVFYSDVYYSSENRMSIHRFTQAYKESNQGAEPDRLAHIGYDVTRFLLNHLTRGGSLTDHLLGAPLYEGIVMRIQFGEQRRNTAMYLFEHTPGGAQLIY